jgi:DNA-binding transcriptional MocR family regulator
MEQWTAFQGQLGRKWIECAGRWTASVVGMATSSVAPRWAAILHGWESGAGPLYRRLAEQLKSAIRQGRLSAEAQLPAERLLARMLGVSRSTVVAAYDDLADDGWLVRRQGSGTRVAARAPRRARVLTLRTPSTSSGEDLDFTIAVPWLDEEQRGHLRRASAHAFEDSSYHPLGLPDLREAVAATYAEQGLPTRPEQILITTGAQQGIALTVAALVRPADVCVLETPTFFGAIDACRAAGAQLVGVRVHTDPPGVALAEADEVIQRHAPRWCFLTPTFQNPTGTLMPIATRRGIAALIDRHRVPLVEDDTLADLSFGESPLASIASLADPDAPVMSVGSLSKLYWAGLRVGWLRVPEPLLPTLAQTKTLADFGSSLPSQRIAVSLVEDLPRLRERRRQLALPSRDLLVALLRANLPHWKFQVPQGGQFLWVELPTSNATGYTQVAARHGVRVFPGAAMVIGDTPDCWLRLPFTMPVELLPEAVSRMTSAWAEFVLRDADTRLS